MFTLIEILRWHPNARLNTRYWTLKTRRDSTEQNDRTWTEVLTRKEFHREISIIKWKIQWNNRTSFNSYRGFHSEPWNLWNSLTHRTETRCACSCLWKLSSLEFSCRTRGQSVWGQLEFSRNHTDTPPGDGPQPQTERGKRRKKAKIFTMIRMRSGIPVLSRKLFVRWRIRCRVTFLDVFPGRWGTCLSFHTSATSY